MARLAHRVKAATATAGTGTVDLGSAETGFQDFAAADDIASGDVVSYFIEDGNAWEVGTGTYTAGAPDTLTRTLLESSTGALLNLTGNATVGITPLVSDFLPRLKHATKTDTQTLSTVDTWTDVSGLSISQEVKAGESVKLDAILSVGVNGSSIEGAWRILRDSTAVLEGAAASSRTQVLGGFGASAPVNLQTLAGSIVDENPGAGTYTYKLQILTNTGIIYVNRTHTDSDTVDYFRGASSLTATVGRVA